LNDSTGLYISTTGASTDIQIDHISTSGSVIDIINHSVNPVLKITNYNGNVATIVQNANSSIFSLTKDSSGAGNIIETNHWGFDPAIQINNYGTGIGLQISHDGTSSSPALDIYASGDESGAAIRINKANHIGGLPVYANNSDASAGGLVPGDFYRLSVVSPLPSPVCVCY
jgi:hypothetical protein